jgi:hypothetical protein
VYEAGAAVVDAVHHGWFHVTRLCA